MNDTEFNTYMAGLDSCLKAENVAVHVRPFLAVSKASTDLKILIAFDDPLAERIRGWFERMYGDRLRAELTLGRSVVAILGDPYPVRLPVTYGAHHADPIGWVEGLTETMLQRLGEDGAAPVRLKLLQLRRGYNLKSFLPAEARSWADVENAVRSILGRPPNYGISRFSSLQAAEKVLKAFIRAHGGKPPTGGPKGHDLEHLRQMAEALAIPDLAQRRIDIPATLVAPIICTASVRYPGDASTLEEAVAAHHASVELCAFLVSHANFMDR